MIRNLKSMELVFTRDNRHSNEHSGSNIEESPVRLPTYKQSSTLHQIILRAIKKSIKGCVILLDFYLNEAAERRRKACLVYNTKCFID